MKLNHLRGCTYTFFLPLGVKLSLFSLYGQQFPKYGSIFKIAIFGHGTWSLAKVLEVAHIASFYPRGVEIELIFALRAVISAIRVDFQNFHIWG